MKTNEIKELHHKPAVELRKMLSDANRELSTMLLDHQLGKLKNVRLITALRKNISQIGTILRGKELSDEKNA